MSSLGPGATIGILGGGQLGRMTAIAAAQLGFRSHILCQDSDEPAAQVATATTIGSFDDTEALTGFAASVDRVTIEFENIPLRALEFLAQHVVVRPGPNVLAIAQDRQAEKSFFQQLGIGTARAAPVSSVTDLRAAVGAIGLPAVLKTARLGYDGKGQLPIGEETDLQAAWAKLATGRAVLERYLDLDCEISVIVARTEGGRMACYAPARNEHRDNILHRTTVPARVPSPIADQAIAATQRIAQELDLVGLLAVEYFITTDGRLLANEMAPRPHNSGHWTLDACGVSQFEQLVRAVGDIPLRDPVRHSNAEMINLLGNDVRRVPDLLSDPGVCLHLYGKKDARPGRKMGHYTKLTPLN